MFFGFEDLQQASDVLRRLGYDVERIEEDNHDKFVVRNGDGKPIACIERRPRTDEDGICYDITYVSGAENDTVRITSYLFGIQHYSETTKDFPLKL